MKILIIGCSCIGKTTVSGKLSSDLGIRAISIDEVIKERWGTILNFQATYQDFYVRMQKKASLVQDATSIEENIIIDVSPIWQYDLLLPIMQRDDVLSILLIDRVEHILEHLVFTDDNDAVEPQSSLSSEEYIHYLRETTSDMMATILYNGTGLDVILDIDGRNVDEFCAEMKKIIMVGKKTKRNHRLLQNAEMLYKRTLTLFEKYSIADESLDYYYYMVNRRFANRQS